MIVARLFAILGLLMLASAAQAAPAHWTQQQNLFETEALVEAASRFAALEVETADGDALPERGHATTAPAIVPVSWSVRPLSVVAGRKRQSLPRAPPFRKA